MKMPRKITFTVNGVKKQVEVKDNELLADVLRDKLQLTGVKQACWRGECGLCTVLLNGKPVKSCLILAVEANGAEIVTSEGLMEGDKLSHLQKSFVENGALQCGFCTPAFTLVTHYLLTQKPDASEEEIREYISGLICRCGTYNEIVKAVKQASQYYKKIRK